MLARARLCTVVAPPETVAQARPPHRTRKVLLVMLGLFGALLAIVLGGAFLAVRSIEGAITYFDDPFAGVTDRPGKPATDDDAQGGPANEPVNILLLGSDSRFSAGNAGQWSFGAQRTDAIMLLHLPADREDVLVVSFPRDSWVPIPGYGSAKINAAYSYGGAPLMIQTFEDLTGIRIDHVAIADFDSFASLTDTLGGVEIPTASGPQLMDGQEALAYARTRYGLPGGDFDRIQRQQAWIRAIGARAFDRSVLTRPDRLLGLVNALDDSLALDEGLGVRTMVSLATSARNLRPDDVSFVTIPVEGLGSSADGQSIVIVDTEGLAELSEAIAEDRAGEYLRDHGDEITQLGATPR